MRVTIQEESNTNQPKKLSELGPGLYCNINSNANTKKYALIGDHGSPVSLWIHKNGKVEMWSGDGCNNGAVFVPTTNSITIHGG